MRINFREIPLCRKFGVEYEVSNNISKHVLGKLIKEYELQTGHNREVKVTLGKTGWAETHKNEYWHVKYDSTCGPIGKGFDSGWEIASFIGCGNRDLEHIAGLADWLHKNGVSINVNCGLHVHVDVSDLSTSQMGNLLARWVKIEQLLMMICHPSRWNNQYCKLLNEKVKKIHADWAFNSNPELFWNYMRPCDLNPHGNEDKKYTLNTVGYAIGLERPSYDRKTIELRLPECILDTNHVINWIRLILNFVDYITDFDFFIPLDLTTVKTIDGLFIFLGLQGNVYFMMLDKPLYDTKIWLLDKLERTYLFDNATLMRKFISEI